MIIREMDVELTDLQDPGFTDVPKEYSGYKEIAKAKQLGIIDGMGDGTFAPHASLTRAQMAKILAGAYDIQGEYSKGFADTNEGYWAHTYISALAANKITIGYPDGTFRPAKKITRQEFSAFLARKLNEEFLPYYYGNTFNNIANGGSFAENGKWTYFGDVGIWRVSDDESEADRLVSDEENDVAFVNVMGEDIYYVNALENFSIYKVYTNGTHRTKLLDVQAMYLHVVDDWMYFVDMEKEAIFKAKLDGSELTKVTDVAAPSAMGVYKNWIYYVDGDKGLTRIQTDGTAKMNLDDKQVSFFAVNDGKLYFVNATDLHLYRMNLDGSNVEKVLDQPMMTFNVSDGMVYYSSQANGKIYQYALDGSIHQKLNTTAIAASILIHGETIYYIGFTQEGTYQWYQMNKSGEEHRPFPVEISFQQNK